MKAILVPVEANALADSVFATAGLLAARLDARIQGVALRPTVVDFIAVDPVVVVMQQPKWDDAEAVATARRRFEDLAARTPSAAGRTLWRDGRTVEDAGLGALGRVFDATVLGRPGIDRDSPRMTSLESALFDSGRPVLVAPPGPPRTLGDKVMIHWNASTETSRAIAAALPLLRLASEVHIVAVEGSPVTGPPAAELVGYLAAHGIEARDIGSRAHPQGPGAAILAEAQTRGIDLLIKGAYTQSRLRQMIFGGATSHILSHSQIPVLFAH
jgi:nucleotide-binding universal stress UspA family protein